MTETTRIDLLFEQLNRWRSFGTDLLVTLILWLYFTLGFICCFAPFYLPALILPSCRIRIIRAVNHKFYRGFFWLCRLLIPGPVWRIDPAIAKIRGSVIVCNHLSYLDSILMISLFRQHTTIVKERLFRIPILNWVLNLSGYLPSTADGPMRDLMVQRMETLCRDLDSGANLFVFPEGTRSRSGAIGEFNPGAFKLARLCRKSIEVLYIHNSDKLFKPGRFLFNTRCRDTINLTVIGRIQPDYDMPGFSTTAVMNQARSMMVKWNQASLMGS